jgi:hypothetical protein
MRLLLLLGGLLGFAVGMAVGLLKGNAWPTLLWRASVAALLLGLLCRWWGRVWFNSWREVQADPASLPAPANAAIASSAPKV